MSSVVTAETDLPASAPLPGIAFLCAWIIPILQTWIPLYGWLVTCNPSSLMLAGESGRLMGQHLLLDYMQLWMPLRATASATVHWKAVLALFLVMYFCIFKNCMRSTLRCQMVSGFIWVSWKLKNSACVCSRLDNVYSRHRMKGTPNPLLLLPAPCSSYIRPPHSWAISNCLHHCIN